jgi:hypothetical protein
MEECVKVMVKSPSQTTCLMEECVRGVMVKSPCLTTYDGGVCKGDGEEPFPDLA